MADGLDDPAERFLVLGIPEAGGKRQVDRVAHSPGDTDIDRLPRAGIVRILMKGDEQHVVVGIKAPLRTVTMMDIPIDDENSFQVVRVLQISRGDGNVVEEAKPHGTIRLGVVPRRADHGKTVVGIASHDRIQHHQQTTARQPSRRVRPGTRCRVTVERMVLTARRRLHLRHMLPAVIREQLIQRGQTRGNLDEPVALVAGEHIEQCLDTLRSFRMVGLGVVLLVSGIDHKSALCHKTKARPIFLDLQRLFRYFLAEFVTYPPNPWTAKSIVPRSPNPTPLNPSGPERFLRVDHLSDDLRGRSVRGGAITITNQGLKFFIALGATAALARLLTPTDFGLIGMAMAVIGFIAVFKDLGLSMATIQRADVSHNQVSTLFWINVGVSVVMMLFVASLAPLLAWYYKEPRVEQITLVLAGTVIFSGLIVQHQALLRRQMRFGALAMAESSGILLAFLSGVVAALAGLGYWSLVIIPVVREVVMMLGVWMLCRWRPGRPVRHSGVRAMVSFGAYLTGFNIVNYFARNLDKILIGRYYGAAALGFFEKAYQMLLLPIQQINNPITGVAVPTLSRLQEEIPRYQAYYRRGVFLTVSIGMPVVVFLFVAADKAVLTLLGDQWVDSIAIFRALGPAAFVGTVNMATGWVYLSLGKTRRQFIWGIYGSAAIVLAYFIGIQWGPIGVALAYSASLIILFPLALVYCFRIAPLGMGDFVRAVRRPATAAILAGVGLFGLNTLFEPNVAVAVQLLMDFFLYAVFYIAIWVGLPNGRNAAREVIDIARQLRPAASRSGNDN